MLTCDPSSVTLADQVQSEIQLPPTSNTGVYLRQTSSSGGERASFVSAGIDWLSFAIYGGWPPGVWDTLSKRLADAKTAARANNEAQAVIETDEGDSVLVKPSGYSNGFDAEWCMDWQGTTIGIAGQRCAAPGQPSACISIPSMPLMLHGHRNRYDGVLGLMRSLGFDLSHVGRPSRFDVCVDLANVCPTEFVKLTKSECYISRAKRAKCPWTDAGERQVDLGKRGKGATALQIYDKLLEVFVHADKVPVMLQRWGGECPKAATRVEWRSGGKSTVMQRFSIQNVEQLFERLPLVCEYLAESFVRYTAEPVDKQNRNHDRAAVHPLWEQVMSGLRDFAGDPSQGWVVPPKRLGNDVKGLKLQGWGCLVAAFVKTEPDASHERFLQWIVEEARQADTEGKITKALRVHAAADPYGKPIKESDIPF